tara:strand:+ start:242 stop:754 length:513 start_codon:yes stop_codon:yes gene_type:complete
MERFDVRRGIIKEVGENGGLSELASEFFDKVERTSEESFEASHGVMTSIVGRFENGALIVDVANVAPDFENPDSMKSAMDDRKRWTTFLDKATGYNSKQRGDKAKEWAKKASKAKSAVSSARHFMGLSDNIPEDKIENAEALIEEIESLLEGNENTKAHGRAEKLNKLFN